MACQHGPVAWLRRRMKFIRDAGAAGHFFCLGFSQGWVCGGEKAEQNQTDGVAAGTALVAAGMADIKDKISL